MTGVNISSDDEKVSAELKPSDNSQIPPQIVGPPAPISSSPMDITLEEAYLLWHVQMEKHKSGEVRVPPGNAGPDSAQSS